MKNIHCKQICLEGQIRSSASFFFNYPEVSTIRILFLLSALFFSTRIFSQQKKDSLVYIPKTDLQLADSLYDKGDLMNAALVYTILLKISLPDSSYYLHLLRAHCFEGMGENKRAVADLEIALQVKEGNKRFNEIKGNSFFLYAKIASDKGKEKTSLAYLTEAAKYSQESDLLSTLAYTQIQFNQYTKALNNLNKAISVNAKNTYAYCNRGLLYLKLNKLDSARADINKSKELDSVNPYVYKHSAMIWLALKNPDSACTELKKAKDLGYYDFGNEADKNEVDVLIDKHCTLKGKPKPDFSFAIRGKAIGFFIIEDTYFRTGTIGAEIIYKDRHSFGIDINYFRWRYEHDNSEDVAMYESYEKRTYLLADYKFRIITIKGAQVYFNLYAKTGKYSGWQEHLDYPYPATMDTSFLRSTTKGTFKETGAGFGVKKYFPDSGWGFDLSANSAWRYSKNDVLTYLAPDESVYGKNLKEQKPVFYMRLNFFFRFNK